MAASYRLIALLVVALAAAGCRAQPERTLDLGSAGVARAALERLPEALEAFRGGRYDRAQEMLEEIRAGLPRARDAATAAVLLELPGAHAYRRLLASVDNNLGLAAFRARRFAQAEEHLRRATRIDPESQKARSNLGLALLHQHEYAQAVAAFEQARRRGARGPRLDLNLARATRSSGDPAAARRVLRRALAALPVDGDLEARHLRNEALIELARVAQDVGDIGGAIAHLEGVLERAPGLVRARYYLAGSLARQGRAADADRQRTLFERDVDRHAAIQHLLGSNPGEVGRLGEIAAGYEQLGLLYLAYVHYRQLRARDPSSDEAVRGLRRIRRRSG